MELTDLQRAYAKWVAQAPFHTGGNCCQGFHLYMNRHLPDEVVCKREVAWREYVRIRDQNPNWPFSYRLSVVGQD